MDVILNIFAALGISLAATSYLSVMLRTYNAKRLVIETLIICMITALVAFSYFPLESSFLVTLGSGGLLLAAGLFSFRKLAKSFEDRYDEARKQRGEQNFKDG